VTFLPHPHPACTTSTATRLLLQAMLAKEKARRAAVLRNAPRFHGRNTSKFTRTHADHSRGVLVSQAQVSDCKGRESVMVGVSDWVMEGGREGGREEEGCSGWVFRCWCSVSCSLRVWMPDMWPSPLMTALFYQGW
jgi:hypothetical protein